MASAEPKDVPLSMPAEPFPPLLWPTWFPRGRRFPPESSNRRRFPPAEEPLPAAFPQPAGASRSACRVAQTWLVSVAEPREYPSCFPLPVNLRTAAAGVNGIPPATITGVMDWNGKWLKLLARQETKRLANKKPCPEAGFLKGSCCEIVRLLA